VNTVIVLGPAGSGKSTLISALCGGGFVVPSLVHRVDCPVAVGYHGSNVAEFVADLPVDAYLESFPVQTTELMFRADSLVRGSLEVLPEPARARIGLDDRPGEKLAEFSGRHRGRVRLARALGAGAMLESGIEFVEVPEGASAKAVSEAAESVKLVVVLLSDKGFESDFVDWLRKIWRELARQSSPDVLVLLNMENGRTDDVVSRTVDAAARTLAHCSFIETEKFIGPVWLGSPEAARDLDRVRAFILAGAIERLKRLENAGEGQ